LEHVRLPASISEIPDEAFFQCGSLEGIVVPEGVARIGKSALESGYGSSLANVQLPDGLVEIGERAFYDCGSLEKINIPDSVTVIADDAFKGCERLLGDVRARIQAVNPNARVQG
jgi:hypothetical protein